jgi:hypothetical protein
MSETPNNRSNWVHVPGHHNGLASLVTIFMQAMVAPYVVGYLASVEQAWIACSSTFAGSSSSVIAQATFQQAGTYAAARFYGLALNPMFWLVAAFMVLHGIRLGKPGYVGIVATWIAGALVSLQLGELLHADFVESWLFWSASLAVTLGCAFVSRLVWR